MNAGLAFAASDCLPENSKILNPRTFNRSEENLGCEFKIHREDLVPVTSTLFCCGDWRWRLCSSHGRVLAMAGGFTCEQECREAVAMLKVNAAQASITAN